MGDTMKLVAVRAALKNKLTKILNEINTNGKSLSLIELQVALDDVTKHQSKLDTLQETMFSLMTTEEEINVQIDAGNDVEEVIKACFIAIRQTMADLKAPNPTAGTSTSVTNPGDSKSDSVKARLPKLELPTFDGNLEHWISFRDQFQSIISDNTSLSDTDKLQYLVSCIKGEAEKLISHFSVSAQNFTPAWELLVKRYDNEREIVFTLVRKLLALPTINGGNDVPNQLRKLLDSFLQVMKLLEVMHREVENWDDLLVVILVDKLDGETRREWAKSLTGTEMPEFKDLEGFLDNYVRGLFAFAGQDKSSNKKEPQVAKSAHVVKGREVHCACCNESHPLFRCQKFKGLKRDEKMSLLRKSNICFNCLIKGHVADKCRWKGTCKKCGERHNTLLHQETEERQYNNQPSQGKSVSTNYVSGGGVLLSTAVVNVVDSSGSLRECRVFLDNGSEASFITEKCVNLLGLKRRKCDVSIKGVGANSLGSAKGNVQFNLKSCVNEFEITVCALVLSKVTGDLPSFSFASQWKSWSHLGGLTLADPNFHEPREVDILLGADVVEHIFLDQRKTGRRNEPVARSSHLGWILSGPVGGNSADVGSSFSTIHTHSAMVGCEEVLQKFWELEKVPDYPNWTQEEKMTETHFLNNFHKEGGRYVVSLPLKPNISSLGRSRDTALKRLFSIEKKLEKFPLQSEQYRKFMHEYLTLGHMEVIPSAECGETIGKTFYLPHHCVEKDDSSSTKLRVVFDGSCKTTSGLSLNDCMMVGPVVQSDIFTHLLRFRLYNVALKADIAKMYRQFLVSPTDRDFQRILWRESPQEPIREYRLRTVTYGTAAAPFLATRVLNQIADEVRSEFPAAAVALKYNFYVDDFLGSRKSAEEAAETKRQLVSALGKAGMELCKWESNDPKLSNQMSKNTDGVCLTMNSLSKALGVVWNSKKDEFSFPDYRSKLTVFTRRHLLKEIARVFDPIGFLAPFTITGKLVFQMLWATDRENGAKMDWDAPIPGSILVGWNSYLEGMGKLSLIKIPRLIVCDNVYEFHGFSDASEKAYGAVIYLRSFSSASISVRFVAAKTKVAPLKTQSLPRLELCGALLLAKLMTAVVTATELNCPMYCWSDSEIVLRWIASPSRRFVSFVANRVSEIQQLVPGESFRFIPGTMNPADCASRGLSVEELASFDLWWTGPEFLMSPGIPNFQLEKEVQKQNLEERKLSLVCHNILIESFLDRYSNIRQLSGVMGYVLRFIQNARTRDTTQRSLPRNRVPPLSVEELQSGLLRCVFISQQHDFADELKRLQKGKSVKKSSRIVSLNPYLDSNGHLRVGGRLQKSQLDESMKHQLVLDGRSDFTKCLVRNLHESLHHGGEMVLRAELQRQYWIVRARNCVKFVLRNCFRCKRIRGLAWKQLMGSLPAPRVTPAFAFERTGVDYCGPFTLQSIGGRGRKPFKSYVAVFICFVVKAVHLEVVTDLTTAGFIGAFKRFSSRRGKPLHLFSDCGTNFVGMDNELREVINSEEFNNDIYKELANDGVDFHFNPPAAPHHGGLWESAVKSVKFHLKAIIGLEVLTISEFSTVLCQVEAVLNSRPLCPLSDGPEELEALTPGHFLIGRSMVALPQRNYEDVPLNRLARWERQERITQTFWRRWTSEYLSSLQQRAKWQSPNENMKVGDLVSIIEENLPPLKWKLGRVVETHPGEDGLIRVVTLKTATGTYTRPIVKVAPLLKKERLEVPFKTTVVNYSIQSAKS